MFPSSSSDALATLPQPEKDCFPEVFRTDPQGPLNPLVLQEEALRQLAAELVSLSPELSATLVKAGQR